ncbi:uncharacterized protein isoform X4 [Leptinotarsa decemlineata]|uniref:uncharacterized protein isoform X4 n=1 Tax=Leptinotarsa decemlineata TaxID=7539 RepID=UPI003D30702D
MRYAKRLLFLTDIISNSWWKNIMRTAVCKMKHVLLDQLQGKINIKSEFVNNPSSWIIIGALNYSPKYILSRSSSTSVSIRCFGPFWTDHDTV